RHTPSASAGRTPRTTPSDPVAANSDTACWFPRAWQSPRIAASSTTCRDTCRGEYRACTETRRRAEVALLVQVGKLIRTIHWFDRNSTDCRKLWHRRSFLVVGALFNDRHVPRLLPLS